VARVQAVRREFDVSAGHQRAWNLLADVQRWPEWAPHITRVDVEPPGPVGPDSTGVLHIRRLGANAFAMTDWRPHRHWRWRGRMPGAIVDYNHEFAAIDETTTRLTWTVDLDGPVAPIIRPIFARLYGSNVDRAIPRLQTWIIQQRTAT
jgi:carbon monoxide dehydrogenase subunit G